MFLFLFRFCLALLLLPSAKQEDRAETTVHMEPDQDHFLPSGSELNITCRLTPCGERTASGVHLVRLGRPLTHGTQHMKGPCAVTLCVPDVTADDAGTFECRYDGWTGGLSPRPTIQVGDPPTFEHFKCASANFASANCSWCSQTKHGWEYESTNVRFRFIDDCTCHICGYDSLRKYGFKECRPDIRRKQFVKYKEYTFNVTMSNKFGTTRRTIRTRINMTHVKPDKVAHIHVANIYATSAQVVWGSPNGLRSYYGALDLDYWLHYSSRYGNNTVPLGPQVFSHVLHGLSPHTAYTISVWSKPILGGYFSDHSTTNMATLETAPGACPVVSLGGYLSVVSETDQRNRAVYVYFESLPAQLRNGVLHGYKIRYSAQGQPGSPRHTTRVITTNRTSTLAKLQLQTDVQYNVTVVAYNRMGESQGCEPITIPPHKKYENVDVMEAEDNGTHITFWWDGSQNKDLQGLVLVECSVSSKSSIVCQGSAEFITIPSNKMPYSHKKRGNKNLVYNKAAIYKGGSSGLEPYWICVRPFNAEVAKPKFDLKMVVDARAAGKLIVVMIQPASCDDHTGRVLFYILRWTLLPANQNKQSRSVKVPGEKRMYPIGKASKSDRYVVKLQAVGRRGPSEWATMEYPTGDMPGDITIPIKISVSVLILIVVVVVVYIARCIYRRKCPAFHAILPPRLYKSLYSVATGEDDAPSSASGGSPASVDTDSSGGYLSVHPTPPTSATSPRSHSQYPGPSLPRRGPYPSGSSDGYTSTRGLDEVGDSSDDRAACLAIPASCEQTLTSGSDTAYPHIASIYLHPPTERPEEVSESSGSKYYSLCSQQTAAVIHAEDQGACCIPMADLSADDVSGDASSTEYNYKETESLFTDSDHG